MALAVAAGIAGLASGAGQAAAQARSGMAGRAVVLRETVSGTACRFSQTGVGAGVAGLTAFPLAGPLMGVAEVQLTQGWGWRTLGATLQLGLAEGRAGPWVRAGVGAMAVPGRCDFTVAALHGETPALAAAGGQSNPFPGHCGLDLRFAWVGGAGLMWQAGKLAVGPEVTMMIATPTDGGFRHLGLGLAAWF